MASDKTEDQDIHDACVSTIANELKKDKWDVKANLKGWPKPSELGGQRPDVEAKKGCLTRVCEVVNEGRLKMERGQVSALKNYCDNYDFHLYVVDKDGKRKLAHTDVLEKE